jgi:flagellar hook-associated protein 1 FlgK
MNGFPIGISALTVGRRGMDLAGQNIANASTPGYRRQAVNASARFVGNSGLGVEVTRLTRYEAPPLRTAILTSNSEQASAATRLDARRQIEAALGSGDGTIGAKLEQLFNSVERLTSRPADFAARQELLTHAADLTGQFTAVSGDIDRLKYDLGRQTTQTVDEVNSLTSRIADLNGRIYAIEVNGEQANELKDQRDQLVDDLSKKVDFRAVNMEYGVVNLIGSSTALVVSNEATQFAVGSNTAGGLDVTVAGQTTPIQFAGGSLSGLLREYNTDIPATRARLDALANATAAGFDKLQATGLGMDGPITSSVGSRPVTDPTQPLATQGMPIPLTNGTLTISMTNLGSQARTSAAIAIDPTTMSLNDVAAAITAGTGGQVTATVDTPQNVLRLTAQSGMGFDFAGRPDSPPAAVFASPTVADTDTANVLAGLGVNGMFEGVGAGNLKVRSDLAADPNKLAASRTGRSGDGTNLERMAAVRDQAVLGGRTLTAEYTDIATGIGVVVNSLGDEQTSRDGLLSSLTAQEQSVVGVDVNEELVKLLDFQRMVEGASRFIQSVNEALDSIIEMTR